MNTTLFHLKKSRLVGALVAMVVFFFTSSPVLAADEKVDASAAQAFAKKSNCLKCHAVDKKKEGPSFHEIATKEKDNTGAEESLAIYLATHGNLTSKGEAEVRNLVRYILSR